MSACRLFFVHGLPILVWMTRTDPQSHLPPENMEAPSFAARLSPHRSLSRNGFIAVMALTGATCFVSGILFMAVGAWPVMAFMGLDVLIIFVAFKLSYRSGMAYEEVAIWPHDLLVRKVSPAGKVAEHRFNPFGTRFAVERHSEIGITRMFLRNRDNELDIGGFLNPADRDSFALAFANALADAKRR